jgi:hypothetical protein
MNKLVLLSLLALSSCVLAAPTDQPENPSTEPTDADLKPAHAVITAIYQRAMVSAVQTKVVELQQKLKAGENVIPTAVDLLKIAILSTPTQDTIKKAAEQVLTLIAPEPKKAVEPPTTTVPEKPTELNPKP